MIIKGLLYIFQKELYIPGRFLAFAYKNKRWWALEKRQKIDWTFKAKLIFILSILLFLFSNYWAYMISPWLLAISLPVSIALLPVLLIISSIIIKPAEFLSKHFIIDRAKKIMANKNFKVIGITGSYGKTTAKEILFKILRSKYKVVKTPENINTELGISQYIINQALELKESDFFIVEMGAYQPGDIKKLCRLVEPDYSLLTGIGEAHLERFGSLANTIKAKFELPQATKKIAILNFDDENIKKHSDLLKLDNCQGVDVREISNVFAKENFSGLEFTFKNIKFNIKLLAKHNINLIILAASLAEHLGISLEESARALIGLEPIAHRLSPIFNKNAGITVLDDSYNGNYDGFISGLEVLKRATGRKIVLTPGIVELGQKNESRHRELAKAYIDNGIDLVILIKNSATKYIAAEFEKNNFKKYKIYDNTLAAHSDLKNILQPGNTILFQNDWPDNYL